MNPNHEESNNDHKDSSTEQTPGLDPEQVKPNLTKIKHLLGPDCRIWGQFSEASDWQANSQKHEEHEESGESEDYQDSKASVTSSESFYSDAEESVTRRSGTESEQEYSDASDFADSWNSSEYSDSDCCESSFTFSEDYKDMEEYMSEDNTQDEEEDNAQNEGENDSQDKERNNTQDKDKENTQDKEEDKVDDKEEDNVQDDNKDDVKDFEEHQFVQTGSATNWFAESSKRWQIIKARGSTGSEALSGNLYANGKFVKRLPKSSMIDELLRRN